jgi:hypothetical protein
MREPGDDSDNLLGEPARLGEHLPARVYADKRECVGKPFRLDLDRLLSQPRVVARKEDLPLVGWVETDGKWCSRENLVKVYALPFDVDVFKSFSVLVGLLAALGIASWVHTTASHTEASPRARVIVPCGELSPADALAVGGVVAVVFNGAGFECDPNAKDYDSRRSYIPGHLPGAPYEWARIEGKPLDGAAYLDVARELAEAKEAERQAVARQRAALRRTLPTRERDGAKYGLAALRSACSNVASAARGGRNDILNREAYAVARLVASGDLDADRVWGELASAARECGLTESEIVKTLTSAFRARARVSA